MSNVKRRYFLVERDDAQEVIERLKADHKANAGARNALQSRYGAAGLMLTQDHKPVSFLYPEGHVVPAGMNYKGRRTSDGKAYMEYAPNRRIRAGKIVAGELEKVPFFNVSYVILKHYGCEEMVPDNTNLAIATAGMIKGQIVVQHPELLDAPWQAPEGFREIKKSEYVALTEE